MTLQLRTVILVAVALTTSVGVGMTLAGASEPDAAPGAAPTLGLAAPGRVEPAGEEREIAARMPGMLVAVHVDENDVVVAGQLLAEIDRSELEAERISAVANIALAEAERDRVRNGARSQERQAARARVHAAEAALTWAEKEHARSVPLRSSGAASDAEVDRAVEQLDSARAQAAEAGKQLALLQAGPRRDELAIAEAKIAVARARLVVIDAQIEKTYVRAPIAGTVLLRHKDAGEIASLQPPTPLFVLGDLSHRMVRAEIDELDVARIHVGDAVEIATDAYPGQRFAGRVTRVAQRVGGKRVFTERPDERQDRKVLDAMIELDPGAELPVGLRVDVFAL